jgi:LmbE family N-acetylglucosaminyl deacetylase
MIDLTDLSRVQSILCVGAHSDDIEIGCGATMLRLLREAPDARVTWAVFCGDERRQAEAREAAREMIGNNRKADVHCFGMKDAHLPGDWLGTKAAFSRLRDAEPDVVFCHRPDDAHQDHRLLGELAGQTFRDHLVLGYEIPKYDGDLGSPNFFAYTSQEDLDRKCAVLNIFRSQCNKHWFDEETFRGLARLRGLECASPTGYAEGFYCRKLAI